jgi:hypothetical protein
MSSLKRVAIRVDAIYREPKTLSASEAAAVYHAAAHLDPLFAWHLNNMAWMAATATDTRAHAGPFAVARAEMACAVSGWGCWRFLGTLAAAFARAGDSAAPSLGSEFAFT